MKYFHCNCFLLYIFGIKWYLFEAKFIARPKDLKAVAGENVTLTWAYKVQWETVKQGTISFGLVNGNGTEYQAILVKNIQYKRSGEFQSVVMKNPVSSSDDSEFSSLRNRSSSMEDHTAQFTISNLSMHDSNKYFCQLKLGQNTWAVVRSYVILKVVDLIFDKEQSSTVVDSWIKHTVYLKCSVRAAPGAHPSFSWRRNLDSTSILQPKQPDRRTQSVLEVLTSENEHFGSYFCTVSTLQSRVELQISIRKLEKPKKITNFDLQYFTNKTGKYVRLFWSPPSNDGGAPVMNYIVKYKQRTNPPQGWSMAKKEKSKIPQVVLKQMNPNVDMYDVHVMARTKVGHGETLEYVLNFAPPIKAKFTSSPSAKNLFVGDDALFEWTYSVHPPDGIRDVTFGVIHNGELHGIVIKKIMHRKPQVAAIIKNGDPAYPVSWFQTRMAAVQNRPASFELFNVRVNDTGFFYCKLNLKQRSLTSNVYLQVVDVKIDKDKSTSVVESWMGNEIRVTCAIRVAPETKPKYSWSRVSDNKTISKGSHVDTEDQSFLTFVTNTSQDFNASGFVCTVRTQSTTARHVVRIKRLYEPMAPTGLQAKQNKSGRTVKFSWSPPKDKGQTHIIGYWIEYRIPGDKWPGTLPTETKKPEFEISAEGEGPRQLYVRVRAENKVGKGPPSKYIMVNLDPAPKVSSRSKNRAHQLSLCLEMLIGAWVLFIATNKVNKRLV